MKNSNLDQTDISPVKLPLSKHFFLMISATVMIASVALSGIGIGINTSAILSSFQATGYFGIVTVLNTLGMAVASAAGASMASSIGIKRAAVLAGAAMAATSILTVWSIHTIFPVFVAARFLLSFSNGLITGSIYPIASYIYSPRDSGKGYAVFTAAIAVGGIVGGVLAGLLADLGMMAWSVAYPGLLCLLASIPVTLIFPDIKASSTKTDYVGLILLTLALLLLLLPLNFLQELGWHHPLILACFLCFAFVSGILFRYEMKHENPVLPIHLLQSPGFAGICIIGFMGTGIFTTLQSTYLPILSQSVLGTSAAVSGLVPSLKTVLTILLPPLLAIWLSKKQGRHWLLLITQGLFVLIPSLLLALFIRAGISLSFLIITVGLVGIAESCKGVAVSNYAQSQLKFEDVSKGIAFLGMTATVSTAIAGAVFGMILNHWDPVSLLPAEIRSFLSDEQLTALSQSGTYAPVNTVVSDILIDLPQDYHEEFAISLERIVHSLGATIGNMFWVCILSGFVVILVSFTVIRKRKLT